MKKNNKNNKKKLKESDDFNRALGAGADSMWSRMSATKKVKDGQAIQDMLGIEDPGPQSGHHATPLRMMDIVLQNWEDNPQETYEEKDEQENVSDEDQQEDK